MTTQQLSGFEQELLNSPIPPFHKYVGCVYIIDCGVGLYIGQTNTTLDRRIRFHVENKSPVYEGFVESGILRYKPIVTLHTHYSLTKSDENTRAMIISHLNYVEAQYIDALKPLGLLNKIPAPAHKIPPEFLFTEVGMYIHKDWRTILRDYA